jgi:hypothetical protein
LLERRGRIPEAAQAYEEIARRTAGTNAARVAAEAAARLRASPAP